MVMKPTCRGAPAGYPGGVQTKKDPNGVSRRGMKPTCRGSWGGIGLFP